MNRNTFVALRNWAHQITATTQEIAKKQNMPEHDFLLSEAMKDLHGYLTEEAYESKSIRESKPFDFK